MIVLQDIVQEVTKELGSFYSTDAHPSDSIYKYIKSAINYICNAKDWGFRKKVYEFDYIKDSVANIPVNLKTYYVLLEGAPQNIVTEEEFFLGNEWVLISVDTFRAGASGKYKILYMPSAPEVNDSVLQIDFPEHFKDVIVSMAVSFARKTTEEYDLANMLKGYVNGELDLIAERQTNVRPRAKVTSIGRQSRRIGRYF